MAETNYLDDILPAGGSTPRWSEGIVAQELYTRQIPNVDMVQGEERYLEVLDNKMTFATSVAPFDLLFCKNKYYSMVSQADPEYGSEYYIKGRRMEITGWKLMDGSTDNMKAQIDRWAHRYFTNPDTYKSARGEVYDKVHTKAYKDINHVPNVLKLVLKNHGFTVTKKGDGSRIIESISNVINNNPDNNYYLNHNLTYLEYYIGKDSRYNLGRYRISVADVDPFYRWGQRTVGTGSKKRSEIWAIEYWKDDFGNVKFFSGSPIYNNQVGDGRTLADEKFEEKIHGYVLKSFVECCVKEMLLYQGYNWVKEQVEIAKNNKDSDNEKQSQDYQFGLVLGQAEKALDSWTGLYVSIMDTGDTSAIQWTGVELISNLADELVKDRGGKNAVQEIAESREVPAGYYSKSNATLPRYSGTLRLEAVPTFANAESFFRENWEKLAFIDLSDILDEIAKDRQGQLKAGANITRVSDTDIALDETFEKVHKAINRVSNPTLYMHHQILRDANFSNRLGFAGLYNRETFWQDAFFKGLIRFEQVNLNVMEKPYLYPEREDSTSKQVVKRTTVTKEKYDEHNAQQISKLIFQKMDPDGTFALDTGNVALAISGVNKTTQYGDTRVYSLRNFEKSLDASRITNLKESAGRSFWHLQLKENPSLATRIIEFTQRQGREIGDNIEDFLDFIDRLDTGEWDGIGFSFEDMQTREEAKENQNKFIMIHSGRLKG